jgi:DNA-binding beta-propeller fold protein YncE
VDTRDFTLLENRFVGLNDYTHFSRASADSCRHILYSIFQVRVYGTSVEARNIETLDKILPSNYRDGYSYRSDRDLAVDARRGRVVVLSFDGHGSSARGTLGSLKLDVDAGNTGAPSPSVARQPLDDIPDPEDLAIDEATGIAYATSWTNPESLLPSPQPVSRLTAVDIDQQQTLGSVELGSGPHALVTDPTDSRVYVSNGADGTVSVVQGVRPTGQQVAPPGC